MSKRFKLGPLALAATVTVLLAACGSSSDGGNTASPAASGSAASSDATTVSVDVGLDKPIELKKGPLKVGMFMNAMVTTYIQAVVDGAKAEAAKHGYTIEVIDANWDQAKMQSAMQSAVTNKTYDAWVVAPIDGQSICKMVTETAPAANIPVALVGTTVCGRDGNPVDEMWAPGTLSWNSVTVSGDYYKRWIDEVGKLYTGKQNVAVIVGPATNGAAQVLTKVVKEYVAAHPDFNVTGFIETDWTAPTTLTNTQAFLQAHPDTTVLLSQSSPNCTQGGIQALQSKGMLGKVKVSDVGAAVYTMEQLKAGNLDMTMPYYPVQMGSNAILSFADAQAGNVKHVYDEVPGGLANAPTVTAANADSFTAQY